MVFKQHRSSEIPPIDGGQKPRSDKLAARTARRLIGDIGARGLKPGARLPNEEDMLNQLGVSRGTLREALRVLDVQGVLEIRPGLSGGAFVSEPTPQHLASVLALQLQFLDAPHYMLVEVRRVLLPEMAALAAERAEQIHLEALERAIETLQSVVKSDANTYLGAHRHLQDVLAWSTENFVLGFLVDAINEVTIHSRIDLDFPEPLRRSQLKLVKNLLKAIQARDPKRARREMFDIVEAADRFLRTHYSDELNRRIQWADSVRA